MQSVYEKHLKTKYVISLKKGMRTTPKPQKKPYKNQKKLAPPQKNLQKTQRKKVLRKKKLKQHR